MVGISSGFQGLKTGRQGKTVSERRKSLPAVDGFGLNGQKLISC